METIKEQFVLTGQFVFGDDRKDYPRLMWRLLNRNLSAAEIRYVRKYLSIIQDAKSEKVTVDIDAEVDAGTLLATTGGHLSIRITNYQLLEHVLSVYVDAQTSTITAKEHHPNGNFLETTDTKRYKDGQFTGRTDQVTNNSGMNISPFLIPYTTVKGIYDKQDSLIGIVINNNELKMNGYANVGNTSVVEVTDLSGNILSSQRFDGRITKERLDEEMREVYRIRHQQPF